MKTLLILVTLAAISPVFSDEPKGPDPLRPGNPTLTNRFQTNEPAFTNGLSTNRPMQPPGFPTNGWQPIRPLPPIQPMPPPGGSPPR